MACFKTLLIFSISQSADLSSLMLLTGWMNTTWETFKDRSLIGGDTSRYNETPDHFIKYCRIQITKNQNSKKSAWLISKWLISRTNLWLLQLNEKWKPVKKSCNENYIVNNRKKTSWIKNFKLNSCNLDLLQSPQKYFLVWPEMLLMK